MNSREKWENIMNYKKVDSIPVLAVEPHLEDMTLRNWYEQGLPQGTMPYDYLKMDKLVKLPINFRPIPAFENKKLYETESFFVEIDNMGATVKRDKKEPNMFYGYIDHPVKGMNDWMIYKERFKAVSDRYYKRMVNNDLVNSTVLELCEDHNKIEFPVGISLFPFFMRLGFYSMGMERFLTAFYDMPELIHDMFAYWTQFVLDILKPLLGKVKLDYVSISEDLAYKNAPHFSPSIYKEFWVPYQTIIIKELKSAGVTLINMWSSGNFDILLPIMMESGVNCTWPLDKNSDMDPIELRKKYGKDLRMAGGISKQTLFDGYDAIDREIDKLMPLIEEGGFIPALDDVVPPETPFANYAYFIEKLRSIKI